MSEWSIGLHERIAQAIKAQRGTRSAQWLANRTAELGYPISRDQIANYESGRKKSMDIAELIVLAAALNTSPVVLVYPGPYDDDVEILPTVNASQFDAARWFSAESDTLPWDEGPERQSKRRYMAMKAERRQWMDATEKYRIFSELVEAEGLLEHYRSSDDVEKFQGVLKFFERRVRKYKDGLQMMDDDA